VTAPDRPTPDLLGALQDSLVSARRRTVDETAADIRERTDPLALTAELERLRARVAELEAGVIRTEWGLRWPEPDGKVRFTGTEEQVKSPHTMHWREGGAEIVQREIREHVGQWKAVQS
jgi:hypothetical protein